MSKTNEKIEEVVKAVDEKMGEGYEVFSNVVQKNNGVKMTAVCIKADKNKIVPNTYIDKYLECMEVEEIADIVCESYMENKETEFDVDCISDKSFILENVIFQMVNKRRIRICFTESLI